ncbi:bacteriophage abortive infection AbiH family protein [Ohtaekwangia koreensis]|uniref:Bacteriophage abortive infection AbiH n=1 Tax=Ohtaekwangia koreensis TaxID=688867 RepID=A0A1T5J6Q8_9BACT|nr:bacteriophage abortive infection AbiH family protein [Ohtaekwangia koreensis]SKC47095.1 Bacteriophage abortive infection AbiH [Ohtaekwangia koreensis]
MKTLYVIGNGFDRYHGLSTSYQSFAFFLQDGYSTIYNYLVEYYGLPNLDKDDQQSHYDPLWSEFEKALADLDFDTVLEDNTDYLPNIASDDFRDSDWHSYQIIMEEIVNDLTKNLFIEFKKFILAVEFPDVIDDRKFKLNKDGLYFSFNYTNTLERYYGIPEKSILYIHNKAVNSDATLILGHGIDPNNFQHHVAEPEPPKGLTDEQLHEWREQISDQYDYSYESGKSALLSYFTKSFKKTSQVIDDNRSFFLDLGQIDRVMILGHSLSEVDMQYFRKIFESIPSKSIEWAVSYHRPEDQQIFKERLMRLGVPEQYCSTFRMEALCR